jgi:hypothetical protein
MTPAQYILLLSFSPCALMAAVAFGVWLHRELALWRTRRRFRALQRDVLELTGDVEAYRLGCVHWELRLARMQAGRGEEEVRA